MSLSVAKKIVSSTEQQLSTIQRIIVDQSICALKQTWLPTRQSIMLPMKRSRGGVPGSQRTLGAKHRRISKRLEQHSGEGGVVISEVVAGSSLPPFVVAPAPQAPLLPVDAPPTRQGGKVWMEGVVFAFWPASDDEKAEEVAFKTSRLANNSKDQGKGKGKEKGNGKGKGQGKAQGKGHGKAGEGSKSKSFRPRMGTGVILYDSRHWSFTSWKDSFVKGQKIVFEGWRCKPFNDDETEAVNVRSLGAL